MSKEVIRQFVDERYPGIWQPSTLTAHLYVCAINNPKSYIHHPHAKRFLYKNADGTFELYDEGSHGPNIWTPDEAEDILGRGADGATVVVELKVGEAKDSAIGQVARYMGWYQKEGKGIVRGILVAADFPEGVQYAASAASNLALRRCRIQLAFGVGA